MNAISLKRALTCNFWHDHNRSCQLLQQGSMDYHQLSRSALIQLLEEHDAALAEAGRDGIIMNYTGRSAPWQIIRQVKPKLSRILKKLSVGDEKAQCENEIWG